MEDIKLLGSWASPFSVRVEIALKLKGIQYEYIEEDLSNKSATLLKYNPVYKMIPVLLHNGKPIAESLVILEYIDETWKDETHLLPKDLNQRAMARFWANFLDEKCLPEMKELCYESNNEVREKARGELHELLKLLENEIIKDKNFFAVNRVGYIEIVSILITYWLGIIHEALKVDILTKEEFPNICAWSEDVISFSFIKENLPPREKILAFYKMYVKPLNVAI
ncbi:glutathione S-transferase U8-like [Nicotiana tabacum]|uniref:glutathione transferase n=2 Tax=Nicotiana TaxID=4085 RepID=A0A1S3Z4V2_TOBAC|nr:PREDICTED: glutathione S-transferase U8-like [Nicotiana sylvestris]XP_016459428.1 PREDICTED: glutathione S-transferase U8-like [Nicotiana tabacum]